MIYQKILVPLDQAENSEIVFQRALEIATPEQTTLMLFHCLSMDAGGVSPYTNLYGQELISFSTSIRNHLDQEIKSVEDWLKNYSEKADQKGIKCEYMWKIGEPSSWIREIAGSWPADLIVIGRRGLSGLTEFFLGSVSNHIVHHVHCSVLIIQ